MKKVVFLANFVLALLEVMSMSTDDFNRNVQHDNVDMCRGLRLTQAETENFLKSQEERKLRNKQDIRLSQQINEMFSSQQPQSQIDSNVESIQGLQYLTADEEITKYWKNSYQTPKIQYSVSFVNLSVNRENPSKVYTKYERSKKQEVSSLSKILKGIEQINVDRKRRFTHVDTSIDTSRTEQENSNISDYISPKRKKIIISDNSPAEISSQESINEKPKTKAAQTRERNNIDKWINKIRTNSEKEIIEELKQMKDSSRKEKINVKDKNGNTPLITAVEMGKGKLAKYLLESGAEVNEKDSNIRTALFYALQSNDKNLAKILINNGASMDILKQNNIFERFEPMICSELIVYGTEINNEVIDLKNLVLSGRAYKTQLDNLAKTVNIKNFKLMDDLFIEVIKQGNLEIVKQLINAGINVNAENTFQEKALIVALENGYTEIAKLLIKNHADINNVCSVNGNTALMIALKSEYPDIVSLLLGRRQNINVQNENGDTSLIIAVNQAKDKKDLKNISKLIKRKADINIQNKNGHTALIRAVLKGSVDIIKLLLENGADINIRNKNGKSELLNVLKASKNKDRVMKILVNNCEEARNYKELMDYLSKPVISEEEELRSSWQ